MPRGNSGRGFNDDGYHLMNKIVMVKRTRRTETSQYPEERTSTETPLVVASERGPGQCSAFRYQNCLESQAIVGDSPVWENKMQRFE